jgi:hypothetical protein
MQRLGTRSGVRDLPGEIVRHGADATLFEGMAVTG